MNKLDFSGKIINMIGNDLFFNKTSRNVTLGNDINIYLKRKTNGVNLIKIIEDETNYVIKTFDNQPKKRKLDLIEEFTITNDEELIVFLNKYF